MSTHNEIKQRRLLIIEALREALQEELRREDSVFLMGQDIGTTPNGWGGPFAVCRGLVEEFGPERIMNAPISEKAIVGACVAAAMMGMRPVCEVQYSDFLFCAMDEIANAAAKMRLMSGGQYKVPMVIRAPNGATSRGAQHAQSMEAFFMHVPGLKVVAPSNPYDAKGLLKAAIRDDSPVLFFEHKLLYGSKGGARKEAGTLDLAMEIPEEEYLVPIGKASLKREGTDVTIVTLAMAVYWSLMAAEELAGAGINAEIIDLRSLLPWDRDAVKKSLQKTGSLVIVEEDTKTLGWGAEVAAFAAEECYEFLKAPVKRVATYDAPIPCASKLENYVLPSKGRVIEAVKAVSRPKYD
ncbi:MAG: alpha-ketoacid dehydrogenase subunit beta [Bacillota bacterium]